MGIHMYPNKGVDVRGQLAQVEAFFSPSNGWKCVMDFVKLHFKIMLLFKGKKKRGKERKMRCSF